MVITLFEATFHFEAPLKIFLYQTILSLFTYSVCDEKVKRVQRTQQFLHHPKDAWNFPILFHANLLNKTRGVTVELLSN